jgi:zinc protease|tara:strand:- start:1141 stop:2415 length:1275 start_codon:yes stop_codon:yes gene_type:complete
MTTSLAKQVIKSTPIKGLNLYSLVTGVDDVVTIKGSFLGGDLFGKGNIIVPEMAALMLDLGTKKRDKFEIGSTLEMVGARLGFSSGRYRVHFSARCLKNDIGLVVELLSEQLMEPAYNKNDLQSMIKRRKAELKKLKEDTRTRAIETFLRELYPEKHPNSPPSLNSQINALGKINVNDLKEFQKKYYGLGSFNICFVGDVDHNSIEQHLIKHFDGWDLNSTSTKQTNKKLSANTFGQHIQKLEHIPDKSSCDLITGHGIGIDQEQKDYYSVMMGQFILGGNFSARLMSTVRDEEGLTYGIQSTISGVEEGNDGYWYIWGTFPPEKIELAKLSIEKQLKLWYKKGVTANELAAKKATICGNYQVGLDTTSGLATRILTTVQRGKRLSFMDEYLDIINGLKLQKINDAISQYCNLENRITVIAGSL